MTFLKQGWQSMGHWRWLNMAPILVALAIATRYEAMPTGWIEWQTRSLGETRITLLTRGALRQGEALDIQLQLSEPGTVSLGFESLSMESFPVNPEQQDSAVQTRIPLPDTPFEKAILIVSKDQHSARWDLGRLIL